MNAPYAASFGPDAPPRRVPVEEYFAAELNALTKHEYVDGFVRAMPGASEPHVLITGALSEFIAPELRRTGTCRLLDQDVQIWIPEFNTYTYPDRAIACPPKFAPRGPASLLNPKVIFEVLSPSTEAYDRGAKFRRYRTLETLEEYVLIATEEPLVEVFTRPEWGVKTYAGIDAVAVLTSVGLQLPLRDLYADLGWALE